MGLFGPPSRAALRNGSLARQNGAVSRLRFEGVGRVTFLLAAGLAGLTPAAGCGRAPSEARPNVLLVCLDTFRADHLGFLGYERETAPFLARLAGEGTVFEAGCSTSSWTAPATASLLTGLYPRRHGVVQGFMAQLHQVKKEQRLAFTAIARDTTTLPERLRRAGYTTLGLSTNINVGTEIGFDRGFDRLETHDGWPAGRARTEAAGWREELDGGEPWFLYLHLNDAHVPYARHADWFRRAGSGLEIDRDRARYDSELGYLDAELWRLFEELGVGDDTLVVIVADHGEEFLEHGGVEHKFSLYREVNQSLFLVRAPGLGVRAQRVGFPVSLVDVAPTVLELAGLDAPDADGRSLAGVLREGASAFPDLAQRTLFAHRTGSYKTQRELWAAMRGRWKLIEGPRGRELYDRLEDPGERVDVASEHPELAAELAAELERHRNGGARPDPTREIELDDELFERLEELGYTE